MHGSAKAPPGRRLSQLGGAALPLEVSMSPRQVSGFGSHVRAHTPTLRLRRPRARHVTYSGRMPLRERFAYTL